MLEISELDAILNSKDTRRARILSEMKRAAREQMGSPSKEKSCSHASCSRLRCKDADSIKHSAGLRSSD